MQKPCLRCAYPFEISDTDLEFLDRVSPVIDGQHCSIPPPTLCPSCRLRRRIAFRNSYSVTTRSSSLSGKNIFTQYYDGVPFPVYANEEWWSDAWDPYEFGRDFDFTRPFFPQWAELRNSVPHPAASVLNMENSDYCNNAGSLKNCYLVFNANATEDSMYSYGLTRSKDCIDCVHTNDSQLCYDCVQCRNCYNVQSSQFSADCTDSAFLINCRSCTNCFGCANLRHAQYCIFNRQYSREAYFDELATINLASYSERKAIAAKVEAFFASEPRPHVQSIRTEDSTGDYLTESKFVTSSYFISGGEHLSHCFHLENGATNCHDVSYFGARLDLCYESAICGINSFDLRFCLDCWDGCANLFYCDMCPGSKSCFGSVGLRKATFSVLNRKYSEKEYNSLVRRIIEHMRDTGEWGEFFPIEHSPFPYNLSEAFRHFPMTQEQCSRAGMLWNERLQPTPTSAVLAASLPDTPPSEGTNSLTVLSALSGRAFKITTEELRRYRLLNVPLPRLSYEERMDERMQRLGGVKLYRRACAKTGKTLMSTAAVSDERVIWEKEEYDREFQ